MFFACIGITFAQNVPTSEEIFNTATNFWYGNDLVGFTTYTTNLYSGAATNYVAPILLSAFHDYAFLAEIISASNKYARVQAKTKTSPDQFTKFFMGILEMSLTFIDNDIRMYKKENIPLTDAILYINPQETRDFDANSKYVLPHFIIIKNAPNIEID